MSLIYWSPCLGELKNQGLSNIQATSSSGYSSNNNGKIGKCIYCTGNVDTGLLGTEWDIGQTSITMGGWFKFPQDAITNVVNDYTYDSTRSYATCTLIGNNSYGGLSILLTTNSIYTDSAFTTLMVHASIRGGSSLNRSTGYVVPFEQWIHILAVFDIVNKKEILYINGQKYTEANITNALSNNPTMRNFGICLNQTDGGNGPSKNLPFYCNDIRVYNHSLSPKEIQMISQGLMIHYKLDRDGFGQDNLLSGTDFNNTPKKFTLQSGTEGGFTFPVSIERNTSYTVSCRMRGNANMTLYLISPSGNQNIIWVNRSDLSPIDYNNYKITFTSPSNKDLSSIYICTRYGASNSAVGDWFEIEPYTLKLEYGSIATRWNPNSSDTEYTNLGLNSNTVPDVSGYGNDGELYLTDSTGTFLYETGSPRYSVAINPHSANSTVHQKAGTTYIRANCDQISPNELTIAFWAYCRELGYGTSLGQGVFSTTNYTGDNSGSDYQASAMNHRDSAVDVNNSAGNTHLRLGISFDKNTWTHYAFTYDGQNARSYKNGVLQDTKSFSAPTNLGSFISVLLGFSKAGGVWRRNDNTYSDFRVYVTCLSQADIMSLYNAPISLANNGVLFAGEFVEEVS